MFDIDLPTVHSDGHFISAKVSRVIELIREYDHHLDVKWVPPDRRGPGDAAFAITERLGDGREVVAFYIDSEENFNEDVLARIYMGDNTKNDVQAFITAKNNAANALLRAKQREELEEYYSLLGSMIISKKHYYKHDGRQYNL
jgi:hypothetical protein